MKTEIEKRRSEKNSRSSLNTTSVVIAKMLAFLGASESALNPNDKTTSFTVNGISEVLKDWTEEQVMDALMKAVNGVIEYDYSLYNRPISVAYVAGLMAVYKKYKNFLPAKPVKELPEHIPSEEELRERSFTTSCCIR